MRTRTRNGTLTLEDSDFIETMGDTVKETYLPRVPAELTYIVVIGDTHVTQDRTRHPWFLAVQLRLTCDQICTGSESLHVKYGAKEKKRNGNNWEP